MKQLKALYEALKLENKIDPNNAYGDLLQNLLDDCKKIMEHPNYETDLVVDEKHKQDFYFLEYGLNEPMQISWNIDKIISLIETINVFPELMSIADFNVCFFNMIHAYDFPVDSPLLKAIPSIPHKTDYLLIAHIPFNNSDIFLDGKHRYMEAAKENRDTVLKYYHLNADMLFSCLATQKDRLIYAFLTNMRAALQMSINMDVNGLTIFRYNNNDFEAVIL